MRSAVLAAIVVAGAVPAAADPAPALAPCGVQIRRAPSELGDGISRRLAQLGACDGRLDVWIVRSEDGLYVIARDELGRVRERLVPDGEVAAALIASWVEVDASMPLTGTGLPAAPASPPPTAAALASADDAPITAPARPPLSDVVDPIPPSAEEPDTELEATMGLTAFAGFTLGGMTSGGAAIDRDLFSHDGAAVALMAILTRDVSSSYYIVRWDDDFFRETGRWGGALMLEIHRRFGAGRMRVTPSVAFGFGATKHEILVAPDAPPDELAMPEMSSETTFGPKIAASIALGVRVGASIDLEIGAGWMFTAFQSGGQGVDPSDQSIVGSVGLRYDR
jgi:hypothetical protein